jgi:hypothetical protein
LQNFFALGERKKHKSELHNFGKIYAALSLPNVEEEKKFARKAGIIKCDSASDADIR